MLFVFISAASLLSPRPRSLFVSPRSPSRPLSKNALSFFLRDLISRAYSSSSSPSGAPSSSSSFRAHSVRRVVASWAFRVMLLSPLSLRQLPGIPLLCLLRFTLRMCSFLLQLVLAWVLALAAVHVV